MALQLGRTIGQGVRRALTPTGYVLMGLMVLYALVFVGAINTIASNAIPPDVQQGQIGFVFPISSGGAALLMGIGFLFGTVLYLAAARGLTRDPEARSGVPTEIFTRRIGWAVLSALGANVIVSIAVTIGFILLIIPGLFLAVSFVFVVFAIGVEDAKAIDALRRSWRLARGNRFRLLVLVLIIGIATGVLGGLGSVLTLVNPSVGQIVSLVLTAILSILGYGVLAEAFVRVRKMDNAAPEATQPPDRDEPAEN